MNTVRFLILTTAIVIIPVSSAFARVWTSKNGQYKLIADEVAFNDEMVVLKKPNGELAAIKLEELSEADQEFARSKETLDKYRKSAEELQTWTGKGGLKVRGRVVAYGRKTVQLQRKNNKMYVDGTAFADIDPMHQKIVLRSLSFLEKKKLEDERDLEKWARRIRGGKKDYTVEGVRLELESGDEIPVPFFLFSDKDLKILEPGWKGWVEADNDEKARQQQDFLMRSAAMAHQRDQELKRRQVEMLKLGLLAVNAGVTDLWEVGLVPGRGTYGRPMTVIVPGDDSRVATNVALHRNPGYTFAGIRKVKNR
jgi:hypothetical protein